MAPQVLCYQSQELTDSTLYFFFREYFLVTDTAIINVDNNIVNMMFMIKIRVSILIAFVKKQKKKSPQTKGKVKSGVVTRSNN